MRTKNERLHQKRRVQIMNAAGICFAKSGFHKTSMKTICERAKMSPGSVYQFFKNKEEIIEAFCDQEVDWIVVEIEKIKKTKDFHKSLVDVSVQYIRASNDQGSVRITFDIFSEATNNKKIQKILQNNEGQIQDSLVGLFTWAQNEHKIGTLFTPQEMARVWGALIDGQVGKIITEPKLSFVKIKKLLLKVLLRITI